MIPGYIDTYKQLELSFKYKIDEQINLYAIGSPLYNKEVLKRQMINYKAACNLKNLISQYNLKQQSLKTAVK